MDVYGLDLLELPDHYHINAQSGTKHPVSSLYRKEMWHTSLTLHRRGGIK